MTRLQSASDQIVQEWSQGKQRHADATFSLEDHRDQRGRVRYDAGSALEIGLPDEVARSVLEGCVKPLDLGLCHDPGSPPVRLLPCRPAARPGTVAGPEKVRDVPCCRRQVPHESRRHLLRDMLVHPERYAEVSLMPVGVEAKVENSASPVQTEDKQMDVKAQQLEELQSFSPEKHLSRPEQHLAFSRFTLYLSVIDRGRLRRAVLDQQVQVVQLIRSVVRNFGQDLAEKAATVVALLPS